MAVRWSWKGEAWSFFGATDINVESRWTQYWRSHLSLDDQSMTRPGDACRTRGTLYVDAGEAIEYLGLVKVPGVDAKLTTDTGLAAVSSPWDVFLFVRFSRLTGVVTLPSCHFNLTPYPLHVIFSLLQRPQNGFSSSHLYPASLHVQQPVLVRLCVAIVKHETSLLQGYGTSASTKIVVVPCVRYDGLLVSDHC
jgi:hypothetical protein